MILLVMYSSHATDYVKEEYPQLYIKYMTPQFALSGNKLPDLFNIIKYEKENSNLDQYLICVINKLKHITYIFKFSFAYVLIWVLFLIILNI
ncbi:hypothetical protein PEPS_45420 (plasmid) [Persicobacter psychrovividus]|uniref:Uncharacterized protein n=1 Tax=Persicobacter psychrovividus TaxID=387638 RepID=A0ABM7VMQ4_9BACT|nr:hypothetical protein PEPS_45420 [Persicobacter psychrovividus]